jgi:EAL domain-containing protein (putative c-di-GMP-specific phosphodiesterase class I)
MLIYDLGNHILRQACKFLKKINDMGYDDIKVSVNISVIQLLRDEFVKDISPNNRIFRNRKKFILYWKSQNP